MHHAIFSKLLATMTKRLRRDIYDLRSEGPEKMVIFVRGRSPEITARLH